MKQFQIAYEDDETLLKELDEIRQWQAANPSYATLFRIYSDDMELSRIKHVCDILDEQMPQAQYLGCTTNANILNGAWEKTHIVLSCTVFEYETTQIKVLQLPLLEREVKQTVGALKACIEENPWVSAVELHASILGMSARRFCNEMSTLPEGIQVFGGGACNPNIDSNTTFIFSKGHDFDGKGIVFLLMGGSDLHTYSTMISGWKPLRRRFQITKSHREVLHELDGQPAFNVYQRFLNIDRNGDKLTSNTVEFPLFMDYKGVDVTRCPIGVDDNGALIMTSDVEQGAFIRLAYGDPETILVSIRRDGQTIANFQPQVIQTFSCAARKAFWGDENISDETVLFNTVAPTSGFYTAGEFLRMNGLVRNFNVTLILAAMREGEPKDDTVVNLYDTKFEKFENDRLPLIRRFVSFIEASTAELEEANQKLAVTSMTDGLTGLYNRSMIEKGINSSLQLSKSGYLSLIMLDIDNFKKVNDTYGHREGDHVIIALSDVLRRVLGDIDSAYSGRWGGEEFMVLLQNVGVEDAANLAEKIRAEFASISYEIAVSQTVSIGVTQARADENFDTLCSRVDKALYSAKANGKNQVVILN